MAAKGTEKVKNVVLVGQGGVGKTMLAEAMLHLTGRTTRLGGHAGTKPTLDYDGEEGERGFSISTAIAPVEWEGTRINVLDAPCYPDFVGDAYAAMSACETALFVVDAASGPGTITTRLWYAAENLSLSRALFINRVDRADADYDLAFATLQERFGTKLGAVTIPMGSGDAFSGVIDVVHMKARHLEGGKPVVTDIPDEFRAAADDARAQLTDLVAEADDEIMMKYLEGEEITQDELEGLLAKAIAERIFVPVFAGSCVREEGVISFMDAVVAWVPPLADFGRIPLVNGAPRRLCLQVPQRPAERPPVLPQGAGRHVDSRPGAHQRPHAQVRAPGPPLPHVRQGDHRRPVRRRGRHRRGSQA